MSNFLCLTLHARYIRIRHLTPTFRLLFCDRCGAIR